jgi:hypothetical protein
LGLYNLGVKAGKPTKFYFKGPDDMSALGVTIRLWDGSLEREFPSAPITDYPLVRGFTGIDAPIPLKSKIAWELSGIPLSIDPSLRMRDLFDGAEIYGALWRNPADGLPPSDRGEYRILQGDDSVPSGKGIWLAAKTGVPMLHLGAAATLPSEASGIFRIRLIKGWNQVTCPSLAAMPWPISHGDTAREDLSPVKGLQGVNPRTGGYQDVDSLVPWKGYFVYSKLDTVMDLLPPSTEPTAKTAAANSVKSGNAAKAVNAMNATNAEKVPVQIMLEPYDANGDQAIRLGAAVYAQDTVGIEDALMAPPPRGRAQLSAVRSGRSLKSDLMGIKPQAAYAWKLAWTSEEGRPSMPRRMRVGAVRMPKGMSLWAASPLRRVAERLETGGMIEVLAGGNDTLIVWAGSADGFGKSPISGFGPVPLIRSATWMPGTGVLRMALPKATDIAATFWDLSGARLARLQKPGLAPGYYEFQVPACRNYPRLMVVTVEYSGGERPGREVFKALAP